MTPDPDIWRAAAILIQRHGATDAALVAVQFAGKVIEKEACMAVRQIDFGFPSAREFWDEVAMPAYRLFEKEPNRAHAMAAALPA